MSIKNRLSKLELSLLPDTDDVHIIRIIVDCGGIEPLGYKCGDVEITRQACETEEELKNRCDAAVIWPLGTSRHIFHPMYGVIEV